MKIAITSPLYVTDQEHIKYIDIFTQSINTRHDFLWIPVINRRDIGFPYKFTKPPLSVFELDGRQPQSVAKAWNDGILKGINEGCEYVLVLNDDIRLRGDSIDNLIDFAEEHKEAILWSMGGVGNEEQLHTDLIFNYSEHPNFQAFMVHKSFIMEFGMFDENFKLGYFEDNDAHARITLSGKKAYIYGGSRNMHYGSKSTSIDKDLHGKVQAAFAKNNEYFISKWGSGPVGDVVNILNNYYKYPFNDEKLKLNYWPGHDLFTNMSKPYEEYIKNFDERYFIGQKVSHYDVYDWEHMKGILSEHADALLSFFPETEIKTILDVGCARGYLARIFKERGYEVIGFDISSWAIENSDETVSDFLSVNDITNEGDFPIQPSDLVICSETLEHVPEDKIDIAIKNLYKLSKKFVLVSTPLKKDETDFYEDGEKTHINVHSRQWWENKLLDYFDYVTEDNLFITRWNFFPLVKSRES